MHPPRRQLTAPILHNDSPHFSATSPVRVERTRLPSTSHIKGEDEWQNIPTFFFWCHLQQRRRVKQWNTLKLSGRSPRRVAVLDRISLPLLLSSSLFRYMAVWLHSRPNTMSFCLSCLLVLLLFLSFFLIACAVNSADVICSSRCLLFCCCSAASPLLLVDR